MNKMGTVIPCPVNYFLPWPSIYSQGYYEALYNLNKMLNTWQSSFMCFLRESVCLQLFRSSTLVITHFRNDVHQIIHVPELQNTKKQRHYFANKGPSSQGYVFQSCMDVRVGLWRKLSAKELMLLNCGVGEDSWESLGLQGDPISPF